MWAEDRNLNYLELQAKHLLETFASVGFYGWLARKCEWRRWVVKIPQNLEQ
jgi:hypothetical protein